MKFCSLCNNLLETSTKTGVLTFKCIACQKIHESLPEDTLMYITKISHTAIAEYREKLLKNAPFDQTIPRENKSCPNCNNKIVSYIRNEDFKQLFVCACGYYWV